MLVVEVIKMATDNYNHYSYVSDSKLGLEPGSLVPGRLDGEPTEDEAVVAQEGHSDINMVHR